MILLECLPNIFGFGLFEFAVFMNLILIILSSLFLYRISGLPKIWLRLILAIFLLILSNALLFRQSLGRPMTHSEAEVFLENNREQIEYLVSLGLNSDLFEEMKIGTTCDGDWRLRLRNGPTVTYPKDQTDRLLSATDSIGINLETMEKVISIIDRMELVAIQKDDFSISIGIRSHGFDGRSEIKYCLQSCDGIVLDSNYRFKSGKPIW